MLKYRSYILIVLLSVLSLVSVKAQKTDTIPYKNVIKYNITAPLLWGRENFILEYERIVSPSRSFNVGLGYRSFPKLIGIGKSDSALIVRDHNNMGGLTANIDYRFYLAKENRYNAPRGIYISPYANYLNNKFKNTISTFYSDMASLSLTTSITAVSVGVQLGYQFVFYDRFSFDMCVVGPSVSWYNVKMKLDGRADVKNKEIFNEVGEYIIEKYPVVGLLFDEYEISGTGRSSKLFYGYKYYFTVGFLF